MMWIFGTIILSLWIYIAAIFGSYKFFRHTLKWSDEGATLGAMGWPLTWGTVILYHLPSLLGRIRLPKLRDKSSELIPGVTKPTVLLEGLVAAQILQKPDLIVEGYRCRSWESNNIRVEAEYFCEGNLDNICIRTPKGTFPAGKQLAKALNQAANTKKERNAAALAAHQENNALSVIEDLMK